MKSLGYLLIVTIKNYFKDMKNHPGKLVVNILFVLFLGFILFSSMSRKDINLNELRDISEMYAIVFALYASTFLLGSLKGFSSGASFYSMADVNMLFSVPISSKKILFYGLIKQTSMSLLVGFLLLFQYSWLNMIYGISISTIFIILLGYSIVMLASQVTAMAIYSYTSGDENKKRVLKGIFIFLGALAVGYILLPVIETREIVLESIVKAVNSNVLEFFPVVGWVKAIVVGILSVNFTKILLGVGFYSIYIVLIIMFIVKSKGDYYEDVLKATEVSFSAITAKKEGNITEAMPAKVKVGKKGISKGKGAVTFFYKHLLEDRRARVFILDKLTLIMLLFCIGYAALLNDVGIGSVFIFTTYIQFFTAFASGRWVRELTLPYVYMVPISPFKKLIAMSLQGVYKTLIEAIVLFVPIGIILHSSILEVVVFIIARVGFGILFMASNTLFTRLMGSLSNKALIMMLYILTIVILSIPGIALGLFISSIINSSVIGVLIGTIISNVLISVLITFLCKNILNYAELNNR